MLIEAWKAREAREERRCASIQLVAAVSQGVKINGRRPVLEDFLPEFAKPPKKKATEADLKAMLMGMAKRKAK
jgi:hypothetical protein